MNTNGDHPAPSPGSEVLTGRDDEVRRLREAVTQLSAGRSGRMIVTGRRGTGVSALLGVAIRAARAAELQVVVARCSVAETELALGTVLELAHGLETGSPRGPVTAPQPVESLVPSLCARFVAAAWRRPLVIVVDDVQWADPLSRAWLRMMMHRSRYAPILLVLGGQTFTAGWTAGPSTDWVVDSQEELTVHPLTEPEVRAVISRRFPGPVDPQFSRTAAAATGGLPGVLVPALDRFAAAGPAPSAVNLPLLIGSAIEVASYRLRDAVASLPADALGLLQAMAICGDALGPDLLAALVRNDRLRTSRILLGAGLVVEGAGGARPVPEAGALALAQLSCAERSALAERAIQLGHRIGLPESRLAALLMGAPPTGEASAGDVLGRVGMHRRMIGEDAAATAMLVRALREPIAPHRRRQLLVELGMSQVASRPDAADRRLHQVLLDGDAEPGEDCVVRAADLLLARGDARATHRALATAGRRMAGQCHPGPLPRPLVALAWAAGIEAGSDSALPVAPLPPLREVPVDPVESGVVGWLVTGRGTERDRARALARFALVAGADQPFVPRILAARVLLATDDVTEAVIGLDDVLVDARRRGARVAVALALLQRGWCELRRGNLAQAADDLAQARAQLPAESWHPRARAAFPALEAALNLARGDLDAAAAVLGSPAAGLAPGSDAGPAWSELCCARGALAMARADPAAALRYFQAAGRALVAVGCINPAVSPWQWLSAAAQLAADDRAAAERTIRHTLGRAQRWGAPNTLRQAHLLAAQILTGAEAGTVPAAGSEPTVTVYGPYASAVLGAFPARPGWAGPGWTGAGTATPSRPGAGLVTGPTATGPTIGPITRPVTGPIPVTAAGAAGGGRARLPERSLRATR